MAVISIYVKSLNSLVRRKIFSNWYIKQAEPCFIYREVSKMQKLQKFKNKGMNKFIVDVEKIRK
jgi:hypothetical protein